MFPVNLNAKYKYTLINKTYVPNIVELKMICDSGIDASYWGKGGKYEKYKQDVKLTHYFGQNRRCAYVEDCLELMHIGRT